MRKISKKHSSKSASLDDTSSDEENSSKHKKVRNEAGKKDGAIESDSENGKNYKNGEGNGKKSRARQNDKKLNDQDEKKKKKNRNKEESDESESEDEALSKMLRASKKSDTSSLKGKGKEKVQSEDEHEVDEINVNEEYEVEEVISHKRSHGRVLYLIRWKGYGADDDTWEKSGTLKNCPEILKKYTDEHPDSIPSSSNKGSHKKQQRDIVEEFDETKDYEVDKILDVFFKKDKSREFLIRWKGYRMDSDSWEPEEQLNCPDLIEKYMAKVERAKSFSEKELRPHPKHTQRFTLRTQTNDRRLSKRHEGKQRAVYYDAEL